MMVNSTVLSTLTQIRTWRAELLEAAADLWTERAQAWEAAYNAVLHEVSQPGGTPWDGAAAEAAAQRVSRDRQTVLGAADSLHGAAAIARSGATNVRMAQQAALEPIGAARRAGFDVEDDLTIVDATMSSTSARGREAVVLNHAKSVWKAAEGLVAVDGTVARALSKAMKCLESLRFPEEPCGDSAAAFATGFGGSGPPLPAAPHLIYCYPSARPDFWWCEG